MMKKLSLLLITGCGVMVPPVLAPDATTEVGGTLVQGSRAWVQRNTCEPATVVGQCVRAAPGPFVLTSVKVSDTCKHPIRTSIADTYADPTNRTSSRWEVAGDVQNVFIVINVGESLYLGTDGYNAIVDGSCFVTWTGRML